MSNTTFPDLAGLILTDEDNICAYAISGQYGALVRVVFILTLVVGIIFYKHDWVLGGTLVFTITYSSTVAIHLILLTFNAVIWPRMGVSSPNKALDLDILPASFILQTAMSASIQIRLRSFYVRGAPAGTGLVLTVWQCLLTATDWAVLIVFQLIDSPVPPSTGICSANYGFLREDQPVIELENTFEEDWGSFTSITLVPWIWSIICMVSVGAYWLRFRGKSFHEFRRRMKRLVHTMDPSSPSLPFLEYTYHRLHIAIRVVHFLSWCALIAHIIAMEYALRKNQLPVGEGLASVGQWAPAVGCVLTLVGSGVIFGFEKDGFTTKGKKGTPRSRGRLCSPINQQQWGYTIPSAGAGNQFSPTPEEQP
ncbi:hypothetical protein P167DRAFT_577636 [Morchella conica CCBAS932]|uniref:Uncharacterized protein n=1 Tax=Morchella conica CCBAS932 TaxID=1392247 RepID=A0A3N4KHU9_9PEZI|nr:hypothetical protein P167DRAFT_577636 [Morchella conica CCBAS932]